jgi:Ca2+-binding RTX toxin-like protein
VYFSGGGGVDDVTFNEGPAGTGGPATYTVANGRFVRSGLPPLHFDTAERLSLYPQDGPSTITMGPTGGAFLQVFGGFFRQKGPDTIDASGADASLFATGSTGDDTIIGSVFQDYIDGGGGNDTIDSRDAFFDQVLCNGGTGSVKVDTLDLVSDCPTAAKSAPLIALSRAKLTPKNVKRGKQVSFSAISTVPGKATLTFKRRKARTKTRKLTVKQGPNAIKFKTPGGLKKGRYSVTAVVTSQGKKSKAVKLSLTLR